MPGRLKETPSIKRARQRAIDAQRKKQQASAGLYSEEESKKRIRKSRMKSAERAGRKAASTALKFSGGY
tara:strand:- start:298 stop:504 length:207 start_codon:yes stop_codon:yes gene_type:complete